MPWKEKTVVKQRHEFITELITEEHSFSQICREYGISRVTGYKWVERYRSGQGMADRSRRPFHSPNQVSKAMEDLIIGTREDHPVWHARKIKRYLEDRGNQGLPAASTIGRILERNGLINVEESEKHMAWQRFERERPNELWQADFKGEFLMKNNQKCYPLTVLDDHSRYSLAVDGKESIKSIGVNESFERVFREYGLPETILTDHGIPWVSKDGYTPFEIWLMKMDILPIHGRAYHPQTRGKEERFHRTMKAELISRRMFENVEEAQREFDRWRYEYNHERPHESLGLEVPAKRYRQSKRKYPDKLNEPEYANGSRLRKVNCKGYLSIDRHRYYLSESFIGKYVGIEPCAEDGILSIRYGGYEIAKVDEQEKVFISRRIQRI